MVSLPLRHSRQKTLLIRVSQGKSARVTQLVSRTSLPNAHNIQMAVRDNLGIKSANEQQLFELDRNGSLPDMNEFLRNSMPQLFQHFAKSHPWILTVNSSNWQDGDRRWPYVLLARSGRDLVPAILNGHLDPTMSDFRDNSGRTGCPDGERVVFLGESPPGLKYSFPAADLSHQLSHHRTNL